MIKFARRQVWLTTAFIKRYYRIIFVSIFISLILGFLLNSFGNRLASRKKTYIVGIVGQYTNQSLPALAKNILNSGLTRIGTNQNVIPNLASWETTDSGKIYTFTLKPNLTWSDGSPVKSSDIIVNIPDVNISYPNDNQISFILPQPFSPFPSVLTNPVTNKNGLTVSPYKVNLTQSANGNLSKITLDSEGLTIIIRIYPSITTAITSYKLGEIDALYNLPKEAINIDLKQYGFTSEIANTNQAIVIFFNNQDPLLKDKSIRQGFAYALKDKTFGEARATGPISINSWAYNPLVKLYEYNLVSATKLIKGSLPDKNQTLNLELATIPQYLSIAEKIKAQLDPNFINLNIKVVANRPDSFQLYLSLFDMGNDPDQYVFWHSTYGTNNISKINDEKIDKDLEDGRRTMNQNERKQIYNNFQRTFTEELPALFLFYPSYIDLARHQSVLDIIKPELAL